MNINVDLNDNALFVGGVICTTVLLCSIVFAAWSYNTTTIKLYTENGYEKISDKGTNCIYWRKAEKK